jgi:5-methylcytosine-specific restriction endonuclease McrA
MTTEADDLLWDPAMSSHYVILWRCHLEHLAPRKAETRRNHRARLELLSYFDGQCAFCSTPLSGDTMTIDHLKALSKGGTNDPLNRVPACKPCNNSKAARKIHHWRYSDLKRKLLKLYGAMK